MKYQRERKCYIKFKRYIRKNTITLKDAWSYLIERIDIMKCSICGKQIEKSSYTNNILCSSECFGIDYWNDKVKIKNDADVVRIEGEHYAIGRENEKFKGYGGRRFKISFFDGRIVETTCLWNNGTIPEEFKHKLPDNARFV